jgi:hypothetical protein
MSNLNASPIPVIFWRLRQYECDEKRAYIASQIQLVGYPRLGSVLKAEELSQLSMIEKMVSLRNGLIVGAILALPSQPAHRESHVGADHNHVPGRQQRGD